MRLGGRAALAAGVLLAFGLLAWVVGSRWAEVRAAAEGLSWWWASAALVCALVSHAMGGFALSAVLTLLGHPLGAPSVLGISLVSTTANYVVSTGGVTGFALKAHLLHKRLVPIATTIVASALTSVILYAVLAAILVQGLLTLTLGVRGSRAGLLEGVAGLSVLLVAAGGLIALFLNGRLRMKAARRVFHWTNQAAFRLSSKEIPRESFLQFERQMAHGLARIRHERGRLGLAVLYTCLDWGFAMISLWLCFRAVGDPLPLGPLSAAFAVGQGATLIPALPGGLGAAEGSTAAVLGALGYDAGRALVAALLYRGAYYIAPSLLSVLVLWGLKVSEPAVLREAAALDRDLSSK
ncbi:MAG: flippase-like domain-containing protein [Elusimicrobiota bacterium]|nr:MAG: flippase-like domain-containing protein [Elusimicrobiota bacterium]